MGRIDHKARKAKAIICLAAILAPNFCSAEDTLVRSRDGRLRAVPVPGAAWCGEVVGVRIDGSPKVFTGDPAFVQKFLAGTRAAVTAECPRAIGIRFHARDGGQMVYRGWSSKADGWAIRELGAASTSSSPSEEAKRREIAHIEAAFLNELAGAKGAKFASDAAAGKAHAAWTISNVSLGLTIADFDRQHPVALAERVRQIAGEAEKSCSSVESRLTSNAEAKAARSTFVCKQMPEPYAWGLLVWENGAQRFMVGLWSSGADRDNGSNLASVASAFERIVGGDW